MIVEDEVLVAQDIRDRLGSMGYSVHGEALSGAEAIKIARELSPDVALMDIKLQGKLDGVATARQFRHELDIPVVYLTAYSDDETLARATETSPQGYLLKPFGDRELHCTIQMALRLHELERNLRESEQRCRDVIERSKAGYFRLDRRGRFAQVNRAWLEMHGFDSADDVIGQDISLTVPPDDLIEAKRELGRALRGETMSMDEGSHLRRDGMIGHHTVSMTPVEVDGKTVGLEGFLIDTSEREFAEDALRTKQAEISTIFETLPEQLVFKDRNAVFRAVNRAFCEYIGKEEEEVIGSTNFDLFDAEEARRHVRDDTLAMASGKMIDEVEPGTGKNSDKWWHVIRLPVMGPEGEPEGIVVSVRDVTARKRAEEARLAAARRDGPVDEPPDGAPAAP